MAAFYILYNAKAITFDMELKAKRMRTHKEPISGWLMAE